MVTLTRYVNREKESSTTTISLEPGEKVPKTESFLFDPDADTHRFLLEKADDYDSATVKASHYELH